MANLTSLQFLYLAYNRLSQVPSSIPSLRNLKSLDLSHNQLKSLPESLGNLASLEHLQVNSNRLTALPESMGQLKVLESLVLNNNQLKALPESMMKNRSDVLSYLDLESNRFDRLPETLGMLQGVDSLLLSRNQLTRLPESIGTFSNLFELTLQSNRLTSVPESISQLTDLFFVNLDNNQLRALPESIGKLRNLGVLSLNSNLLRTLPKSIGSLQLLHRLALDNNQLNSLPQLPSQLLQFRAANNQLAHFVDLGNLKQLQLLALHDNQLTGFSKSTNFPNLEVALLHSNRLRDPLEICRFGAAVTVLYLHGNEMQGEIPETCLSHLGHLEVLTLHRNWLTGPVPGGLLALRNLTVLTLHQNRLQGNLPSEVTTAPNLTFFSAHSNRLEGPIPSFKLLKDCVNDVSFVSEHVTCETIPWVLLGRSCSEHSVFGFYCPKTCGLCSKASARGPVLLLHNNRFSCSLPQEVTNFPQDVRSITLVGNMLGNGSPQLPSWIHSDEHQPFLYVSSNRTIEIFKRATVLALAFAACWVLLYGKNGRQIVSLQAGSELTKVHRFLFQMGVVLLVLAMFLLGMYRANARYYECGYSFSSATVSHFSNPGSGAVSEWLVSIIWVLWIAVGASLLRGAPKKDASQSETDGRSGKTRCFATAIKAIYSVCWFCIVVILSLPSIAYALVCAIPFNNTLRLSTWWLQFFHYQAAASMVLIDMFITPRVVKVFSELTGIRRSMLLMAARLGTMWLAAVVSTIYLTTHCMNGWTHFWKVSW
eukprot:Skav217993  [mRNA]  locus=scaffold3329:193907:196198:- [translate_table: standard]